MGLGLGAASGCASCSCPLGTVLMGSSTATCCSHFPFFLSLVFLIWSSVAGWSWFHLLSVILQFRGLYGKNCSLPGISCLLCPRVLLLAFLTNQHHQHLFHATLPDEGSRTWNQTVTETLERSARQGRVMTMAFELLELIY